MWGAQSITVAWRRGIEYCAGAAQLWGFPCETKKPLRSIGGVFFGSPGFVRTDACFRSRVTQAAARTQRPATGVAESYDFALVRRVLSNCRLVPTKCRRDKSMYRCGSLGSGTGLSCNHGRSHVGTPLLGLLLVQEIEGAALGIREACRGLAGLRATAVAHNNEIRGRITP